MEQILAGIFAIMIGLVGSWAGITGLRNRLILSRWQLAPGKVIERGTFQPNIATMSQSAYRHSPLVKYKYEVAGQEFVNDCIRPKRLQLPQHSTRNWAQKQVEAFPNEVTVHYNPADPGDSYLVLTPKSLFYLVIGASCFAFLYGAITLLGAV